jgi:hypothetical protein
MVTSRLRANRQIPGHAASHGDLFSLAAHQGLIPQCVICLYRAFLPAVLLYRVDKSLFNLLQARMGRRCKNGNFAALSLNDEADRELLDK